MALVQPKKPVGGAYGVFMSEKRPEFLKKCAGQKASAVAKMAGEAWGTLSDTQKAPYQKKYEAAKTQFDKEMAAFLAAGGVKEKGLLAQRSEKRKEKEGKKKKKDPNAPKKPAGGAYGVYLTENREKIKKSLPKDHKITDVSKAAGAQWKGLSDAAKKPYEAKYQKKMSDYKAAMEEYRKTHGANEDEEDNEEDADDDDDENDDDEEDEQPAPKKKIRSAGA